MASWKRCAKINVKVLIILMIIVVAIGASLFAARHVRRRLLSRMDLNAGQAAYESKDWPAAYSRFQEYLGRNPDDLEILKKYAEARMNMRPLDAGAIGGVIGAYRRIIQVDPNDEATYEQLAKMYTYSRQFDELIYIAGMRKDQAFPDDQKWPLWRATALVRLDKMDDPNIVALEEFIEQLDPAKHPEEYVQACTLRTEIILSDDSDDSAEARQDRAKEALASLDKAVNGVPDSAEALATRARFYRASADLPGMTGDARMAAARADLDAADKIGTENAQIRSRLCAEWIAHNDPNKAYEELQAVDNLTQEVMEEQFFDVNDWTATRFIWAAEVAMRRGDPNEAASLADEVRAVLTEKRHRAQIMDPAIISYITVGNVTDANSCLDEYLDATRGAGSTTQGTLRIAFLQALVARAQDRPYAVIDILQPVLLDDVSDSRLWRLLAEAYGRTNQSSRAISALTRYVRLRPQDSQARLQLAEEHLKLRDWNGVLEHAQLAESLNPDDTVARLLRIEASTHIATGQGETGATGLEELSSQLTELRQKHPERVDVRILQAIIALNIGQSEEAEKELKLAIEECEEPLKLRAEMQLARHYYGEKRITEAISTCKTACGRNPELGEPWLLLADLHAANADPNSAHGCLEQSLNAVAGDGDKRALTIKLALLELTQGERAGGIDRLTKLAAKDKQDIRVRSLLLGVREVLEDPNGAAQQFVDELKAAEGQSGVLWRLNQASVWLLSDDWRSRQPDITDALQYCIDADPKWSAPVLLLARMYDMLDDSRRVEDTCRQALARNPSATDVANALMALLQKQNRFSDAEKVLQQIKASPEAASAWNLRLALGSGDYSRAIEELRVKVSNDEQDANSQIMLARLVYLQNRDFDQAIEHLKKAETIDPNSMALIAAKVAILKADGQAEEARRVLDDYVVKGDDFGAYMLRAAYLAGEGELESAERDYEKLTTFADQSATGYGLLSNFYTTNQDLDKAVETLEKGLEAYPVDLSLERALMKTLFRRDRDQDSKKALEILSKLEGQLPQDRELMKIRALRMREEGTPQSIQAAREKLTSVIKLEPTAVDAHLMLIGITIEQGEYELARDLVIQAIGSNPDNSALLSVRSRIELEIGNMQMATQLAHLAIQKDPNSADALGALVNTALLSKEQSLLEEARTRIESALTGGPADEKLLLSRSHVLTSLGLPATAIPELESYCQTKEGSSSIVAIVTLADLHRLAGDLDKAEQKIEQAERLDPNSQTVVHARFVWLVVQKRFEELEQISSAYLSAKEQNPTTLVAAASILSRLDSTKLKNEAIKLFKHAVSLSPALVSARLGLASTLYQTGDADSAKKVYQELLDQYENKYPENIRIYNDLAWILQEHDHDYDTALDLANKGLNAARNDNDRLHLLDTRGTILFNMKRYAEAKADFEKLVALALAMSDTPTPRQAKALLELGTTCAELKEFDQAKEHLNKALEIDRKINVFTPEERSDIAEIIQK